MGSNRIMQVCLQDSRSAAEKEDIFVNITLRHVPCDLLREFARKIAVNYRGGTGEAIQDLMRRATKE